MCLTISNNWEEDLRKFINGRKTITVLKIIKEIETSIYNDYLWEKGINYSSRENSKLTDEEIETHQINKGFHFYNNKEDMTKCRYTESELDACPYPYPCLYPRLCPYRSRHRCRLIKLTIKINDLVAVGKFIEVE